MKLKANEVGISHAEKPKRTNPFKLLVPLFMSVYFGLTGCGGKHPIYRVELPPGNPAAQDTSKTSPNNTSEESINTPKTYQAPVPDSSHSILYFPFKVPGSEEDPNIKDVIITVYTPKGKKQYYITKNGRPEADMLVMRRGVEGDSIIGMRDGEPIFYMENEKGRTPEITIIRNRLFKVDIRSGITNLPNSLPDVTKIEVSHGLLKIYGIVESIDDKTNKKVKKEEVILQVEVPEEGRVVVKEYTVTGENEGIIVEKPGLITIYEGKGYVVFGRESQTQFRLDIYSKYMVGALQPRSATTEPFIPYPGISPFPNPGSITSVGRGIYIVFSLDNLWQLYLCKFFGEGNPSLTDLMVGENLWNDDLLYNADRYREITRTMDPNAGISLYMAGSNNFFGLGGLYENFGLRIEGIAEGDSAGLTIKPHLGLSAASSGNSAGGVFGVRFDPLTINKAWSITKGDDTTVTIYDYIMPSVDFGGEIRLGGVNKPYIVFGLSTENLLCQPVGDEYDYRSDSGRLIEEGKKPYTAKPPVGANIGFLITAPGILDIGVYSKLLFERDPFFTLEPWREGNQKLILSDQSRLFGFGLNIYQLPVTIYMGSYYDFITREWFLGTGLYSRSPIIGSLTGGRKGGSSTLSGAIKF
ncbi:MAG: hypothetical protein QXL47_00350 [Candidatus Anstonellales archaeon]